MAETVTKVVQGVDSLFDEIVINGRTVKSRAPSVQTSQNTPSQQTSTPVQGEHVEAVQLNDIIHNLKDKALTTAVSNILSLIPSEASDSNKLADKSYVADTINALDVPSAGGSGKYISAISETDGKISATASDLATSVASGNNAPVTSGAVADILSNLPTDAVLHYSFDELPDYPDGTADVRLINNDTYVIQSGNYKFSDINSHGTVFTNVNGKLQIETQTGNQYGAQILNTYIINKCIKLKIKVTSISGTLLVKDGTGTGGITIGEITQTGIYEYTFIHDSSATYNNFYLITSGATSSATLIVEQIYIGNGSYSTPVIDNANGENNSVSASGVTVKGVSGKGARFFPGKYVQIKSGFDMTPNFSLSVWFNLNGGTANGHLFRNTSVISVVLHSTQRLGIYLYDENGNALLSNVELMSFSSNVFHHLVITRNGTDFRAYLDGVKKYTTTLTNGTIRTNAGSFTCGSSTGTVDFIEDDLLIFDRALTETEITALYQNKANTPKYFPTLTNEIKEGSQELVTSSAVFAVEALKCNFYNNNNLNVSDCNNLPEGFYSAKGLTNRPSGISDGSWAVYFTQLLNNNPLYKKQLCFHGENKTLSMRGCNNGTWETWSVIGNPVAPTTDGTYTLQCSVSSGVPTYSWVSSGNRSAPETREEPPTEEDQR